MAWDFARESGVDLVAVDPGLVLGPLHSPTVGTTAQVVQRLLTRDVPASPKVGFAPVDVRDIAAVPAEEFNPLGYRVPTGSLPKLLLRVMARFDSSIRPALDFVGRRELVSADKARRELGWTMRPVRDTILDAARSLIELGLAPRPSKKVTVAASAPAAQGNHGGGRSRKRV